MENEALDTGAGVGLEEGDQVSVSEIDGVSFVGVCQAFQAQFTGIVETE